MGRGMCQGVWVVIYQRGVVHQGILYVEQNGTWYMSRGVDSDIPGGSGSPGDLVRGTKWDVVHVKGDG